MAEFDVVQYLASKGLRGRQGSGTEVSYPCFMDCHEAPDSRKRKWYLNTEEGLWTCFVCGASGGTYLLQKHFGDEPQRPLPGEDRHVRRRILDWAAETGSVFLSNNDEVLLYLLNERGLSAETILERKLGYVGPQWSLTGSLPEEFTREELRGTGLVWKDGQRAGQDFFYNHLLIPYISRGAVVQIRGRQWGERGAKYVTGPGESVRLFNADSLDGAEDVLICEGELDCMILHQVLSTAADDRARKIAVVALPGTQAKPEGFERYFADAKRIWIGMDADDAGRREAVKLKERFGVRSRILELPEGLPRADWTEYLLPVPVDADEGWRLSHPYAGHTAADVMRLLGTAAGRRVFTVADAGASWRTQRKQSTGLKTGYEQLDATLQPGLLPGQVMVILAKTGAGKSVLLCNLAFFMRQHRILFISLEMTREEIYERLRRIYLFWRPLASDVEVEFALANIYICDENRLSDRDFASIIDEFENEVGSVPEVCFVDYLGYFARGQKGNSAYEKTTNAVMQLKAVAKGTDPGKRFAIISPHQVNRVAKEGKPIDMDDARDSVTGDTYITLADGSRRQIQDLVGSTPEVVALGTDFRYRRRPAVRVWRKAEREVYRVTTGSGRAVKVTAEHPFFTVDGWRELAKLKPGHSIAVPERMEVFGTMSLPGAELLGHLTADGGLTKTPITYTKESVSLRERVGLLAREFGISVHGKQGEPMTVVLPASAHGGRPNPLTDYLREHGMWGVKSPGRRVPEAVWTASRDDVAAFIRGLWSGDGSVTNRGTAYTTASEDLARDLQALLLRFGVHSYLTQEAYGDGAYVEGSCWRVNIRESVALVRFAKEIGLMAEKGILLDHLVSNRVGARASGGSQRSLPVEVWEHIHRVRTRQRKTWADVFGGSGVDSRRRLSVERARKIAETLDDKWLTDLANADVRFEEIVSIEPAGIEWVYDISVQGLHNFVANEITVSNSGAVEETADFLLSIWRPDDALMAESPAQPSGKIKITVLKSRHGGKDRTFTMAFDSLTLAIVDDHTPASKRALEHNYKAWRGWTYDAMRAAETAPVQEKLPHIGAVR